MLSAATASSTHITSRQNSIVARYRAVAQGDADGLVLLDGVHLVNDAVSAGVSIEHATVDVNASERDEVARLLASLRARGVETVTATAPVMAALSLVRSSSAIVAIARRPSRTVAELFAGPAPLVVVACDVQDPGNMGAIVRVAEAGGASGVIATGMTADPFGWKALRGSMGSALRLPVHRMPDIAIVVADARQHHCRIIATVPRRGASLFEVDLRQPTAVLIGSEGPGLPDAVVDAADARVTIPMQPPVESLNAAVTAALVVYEARRQRTNARGKT
jgi:TrmH family RNA methyltransferase